RIPVPAWWETTPVGAYDGHAWYRVRFTVPQEMQGRELTLEFAGVDESAWVYLNGELIGERSTQSTGLPPLDFWDKPFSVPMKGVRFGQENVLAVKVYDSEQMGGIFRPVRVLVAP
ncbi:MAG: sugar-binding domain-containing protein, partial [candidate division WOR-3 bacterium]